MLPTEYATLITGAISAVLAFVSSGIFSNIIAGLLIWIIDPIDIGDIVKVKGHKGVVKSINLTRVVIETFDRILVEIANSDLISSILLNYTIKLRPKKKYFYFKRAIRAPQDIGNARLDMDIYNDDLRREEENEYRDYFETITENQHSIVHSFTFKMRFPYEKFRIKIDKTEQLCQDYRKFFGFRPKFHITGFSNEIVVKFRILTLDSNKLFKFQPEFAKDIYKIILSKV